MKKKTEYSEAYINIIKNLKKLRVAHSYSQDNIAGILNLTRSAYTYIETGKSKIEVMALLALMELYDVTIDELCQPMETVLTRIRPARQAERRVIPEPESTMQLTPEERTLIANYRLSRSVPELVTRLKDSNMPVFFKHK